MNTGDDTFWIFVMGVMGLGVIVLVALLLLGSDEPLDGSCPKGTVVVKETADERICKQIKRPARESKGP